MKQVDDEFRRVSPVELEESQGSSGQLGSPEVALQKRGGNDDSSLSAESGADHLRSSPFQAQTGKNLQLRKLGCHNSCRIDIFMDEFSAEEKSMHAFLDELDLNLISVKTVIEDNNTAYKSPAVREEFEKQSVQSNSPTKMAKAPSLWQRRNLAAVGKKLSINSFGGISSSFQDQNGIDGSEAAKL